MSWGLDVQTTINNTDQDSYVYNKADKYTDQSVKDTLIQNYITKITTRDENITELIKSFENNVSAIAESVQENQLEFGVCVDLKDASILQSNELIQNVSQGFEQLNEDIKVLQRVLDVNADTEIDVDQGSESSQEASSKTDQDTKQEQEATEESTQEAFLYNNLNKYNRTKIRDMLNKEKNLIRRRTRNDKRYIRNKRLSAREYFNSLLHQNCKLRKSNNKREPFCFIICADIQTIVNDTTQHSTTINEDLQTNIETQEIYKKIDTAYDKVVETINKLSETYNQSTKTVAEASSIQRNVFTIKTEADICKLNINGLEVEQQNKLAQQAELTAVMQNINALTQDNEIRAIMADMMGLTQKSDIDQSSSSSTDQTADVSQSSEQKASQKISSLGMVILIIVAIVIVSGGIFGMVKSSKSFDAWFDAVNEVVDKVASSDLTKVATKTLTSLDSLNSLDKLKTYTDSTHTIIPGLINEATSSTI